MTSGPTLGRSGSDDPSSQRDEALIRRLHHAVEPLFRWYFRPRIRGMNHVPAGPCLLVGNHNGAMLMVDMVILTMALYRERGFEGLPFGLGHRLALRLPWLGRLLLRLGAVPGTADSALELFRQGRKVLVYPGGELDSMRCTWDRGRVEFGPRRGYLRLALQAGVPLIPVVTAGAHETLLILNNGRRLARWLQLDRRFDLHAWPLTLSIPWGLWLGIPPPHLPWRTRIKIEILEPLRFERVGPDAARDRDYVERCHHRVHQRMEHTLRQLIAAGDAGP